MRRLLTCILLLCLVLNLSACKKQEDEPPEDGGGSVEEPQTPDAQPAAPSEPADEEEMTLYPRGDVTIALPKKYVSQLFFDDGKEAVETSISLLRVYERASLDAAEKDFGDSAGFGLLFEISQIEAGELEQFEDLQLPASWVFARDDEHYYIYTEPTDVQLYRQGGVFQEEDLETWNTLSDLGPQAREDMIVRNGLTPWGDDA